MRRNKKENKTKFSIIFIFNKVEAKTMYYVVEYERYMLIMDFIYHVMVVAYIIGCKYNNNLTVIISSRAGERGTKWRSWEF